MPDLQCHLCCDQLAETLTGGCLQVANFILSLTQNKGAFRTVLKHNLKAVGAEDAVAELCAQKQKE